MNPIDKVEKGLGPFPGGNNPFRCDFIHDGIRCENHAAYVFRTVTNTRLCCDSCQRLYWAEGSRGRVTAPPIVEFSLLELIPARSALLARLEAQGREIDELRRRDIIGALGWVWRKAWVWVRARLPRRRVVLKAAEVAELTKAARERARRP